MLGQRRHLAAYGALLGNRDYRLLFASGLGSGFGDWLGLFALQVLVVSLAEPGSSLALFGLGAIMMARVLPSVLFGPFAGVLADRMDRKRLLIGCDLARAGLFAVIALSSDLVALLALIFAAECCTMAYVAAKNAVIPTVVDTDELAEANQLNLLVAYGPLPFGAGVATVMSWLAGVLDIGADPTRLALWLNATTFLVAAVLLVPLGRTARGASLQGQVDQAPSEGADRDDDARGALAELRQGLAFVRGHRLVRALMLGVVGVFFGAGVIVAVGPEFVRATLGRSESDWYGLATTVGFGLLAGLVVGPLLLRRLGGERLFAVSLVGAGLAAVAAAWATAYWLVQVLGAALGAFVGASFVTGYTVLQVHSPDHVRGRTFAALFTSTRLALFLALALGPVAAGLARAPLVAGIEMDGIRLVLAAGGLVGLLSAVAAGRGIRRALRDEGEAT
jgi:dTMP kinase